MLSTIHPDPLRRLSHDWDRRGAGNAVAAYNAAKRMGAPGIESREQAGPGSEVTETRQNAVGTTGA
jgi:hypothetical protein